MKNTVKRALSVLSALALIIASLGLYPTDSFASEEKLYAARLGLDNGKVSGYGTPAELLATNAIYQEVYNSQTKGSGDFDQKGGDQ